jgi:magnesium chelatase subunit I
MSIANYETLVASAVRRSLLLGETEAVPRISDLPALHASTTGKIELEYAGVERSESELLNDITRRATRRVFESLLSLEELESVVESFDQGWQVEVSVDLPSVEYLDGLDEIEGLREAAERISGSDSPASLASAIEFILEGLHLSNRLNKNELDRGVRYQKA